MKHYLNTETNEIYAYELDGSQDHLIPDSYQPLTDTELESIRAKQTQDAFDALTYQQKRQAEYPSFIDYIDGVVKGDQQQIQDYIDACLAIKAKYPKE